MPAVRYALTGGLTPEQIQRMHEHALHLIERVGLRAPHEAARRRLAEHDGVQVAGEDVRFRPDVVEGALARMQWPEWMSDGQFRIISGAYALSVEDLGSGEFRPATLEDLRQMVRLQDSFGLHGSAPLRPQDVPGPLQEIVMYQTCWQNSRHISGDIFDASEKSSIETAETVYEMSQVAGKRFSLGFWIVSPFRMTHDELDIIWRFRDRKVPLWCATMPVAGATAPIFLPGAYVQSMAELFAGVTLLSLLSPASDVRCLVVDSIRAYPFDMKYGSFVYGSPEDTLATLIQVQLNARYGIPVVAKSLLTNSQQPDGQAAAEKAAHTLAAALAGARIFTNAGLLSVDEVYSPAQLVIDNEIVQYVRRVVEGFEFSEEAMAVDAIREVGPGGHFLDHPTTVAHCRDAFWAPELFEHRMLAQWREAGARSLPERAREIARRRIAQHEFELPAEVRRELDAIVARAAERLR
jgi:trimethylamine--corrinoid protein Co-methyltransferase